MLNNDANKSPYFRFQTENQKHENGTQDSQEEKREDVHLLQEEQDHPSTEWEEVQADKEDAEEDEEERL